MEEVIIGGVRYIPAPPEVENPGLLDFWFEFEIGKMRIRDYLCALLTKLWQEVEDFSGKRPFGSSGWEWELYKALISAGAVKGKLDEYGHIETLANLQECDTIILGLIAEMCKKHDNVE